MTRAADAAAPFPWDAAIAFGLGVLRLAPEAFWRMTPRELAHAMRAHLPAPSPSLPRSAFARLMQRFPD